MPGRNGTGPQGMGPMTGRGMGVCSGNPQPYTGYGYGYGRGFGGGFARGMGYGRGLGFGGGRFRGRFAGYPAGPVYGTALSDPQSEKTYLEGEANAMQTALEQIKKRLDQLKTDQS
jgi:hypothetical protein